jgi:hypothetical protein
MPKRSSLLDRINIASPCSADWDRMIGNEQVRFCQHCSLHVHHLSKITRKDALRLIAGSKGKLCVRYYRRPDGAVPTATHAQPLSQIKRRLSRIAAGAFTATLSLASNAAAQSSQPAERDPVVVISPATARERMPSVNPGGQTASLVGTIIDPAQAVVPAANVTLINEETGQETSTASNDGGTYQFQAIEAGMYKLRIESPGFATYQKEKVVLQNGGEERADATLDVGVVTMGGMVVISPDTPLINAIWNEEEAEVVAEVRKVLAMGVDVNMVDRNTDSTALGEAVATGNLELVQTFLYAGADPNIRNSNGQTALMRLDDDGTAEIVRALVGAGAKVNLKDEEGDSALLVAAALENTDVLRALLDAGAKVNTKNKEGKTALMIAAEEGYPENVKALLMAGADVHRKDKDGATALKHARENDKGDVANTLIAYGAFE